MRNTNIEWTDSTVNFWTGCQKVSEGCKFCYMYRDQTKYGKDPKSITRSSDKTFYQIREWKDPRFVFVSSYTDFFIQEGDELREEAWDEIRQAPQHIYQILTKRPERILECLPADWGEGWDHVWLGVSIENQANLHRATTLAKIPAKTRFISAEPLIGEIDFAAPEYCQLVHDNFHWCIIGGESGDEEGPYRYRECKLDWIEKIVNDLKGTGVEVFVKQMGTHLANELGMQDKHGRDIDSFPEHLRIREFPAQAQAILSSRAAQQNKPVVSNNQPIYVKTARQIRALGITEIPMLVSPILEQAAVGCLCGGSDTGKSYLGLDLAIAICSDQPDFLGMKINRKHGSAIIVSTEDSEQNLCVRLNNLLKNRTTNEENLRFICEINDLPRQLEAELKRQPVDFVFLDTFRDLFKKNINDSIDIANFFAPYKKLSAKYQCMILINHHIGKSKESNLKPNKNDVLGSEAIQSSSRVVLHLAKSNGDTSLLTVVKGNNIPEEHKNKGWILKFDINSGYTHASSQQTDEQKEKEETALDQRVAKLLKDNKSVRQIADELKEEGIQIGKTKVGEICQRLKSTMKKMDDGDVAACPPVLPPGESNGGQLQIQYPSVSKAYNRRMLKSRSRILLMPIWKVLLNHARRSKINLQKP